MKDNKATKSLIISLLLLFIFVITATTIIVYSTTPNKPIAFFARSLNDASYDCENKINNHFKKRLLNKYFDSFSSRYEPDKRQYLIYYRISVRTVTDNIPVHTDHLAKCVVWERLGYVSEFRVMDI